MRIARFKIDKSLASEKMLREIDLTKKELGSTVALVGKNGAGKTRILKFVENYFANLKVDELVADFITHIPIAISEKYPQSLRDEKRRIDRLSKTPAGGAQAQQMKNQITNLENQYLKRIKQFGPAYIKVVDSDELKTIKDSIPIQGKQMTFEQILSNVHFDNLLKPTNTPQQSPYFVLNEFTTFNSRPTIEYLKNLTNEIVTEEFNLFIKNRENPSTISDEIKKHRSFQLFCVFQNYVWKFLGKEFSYKQTTEGNTFNSVLYFNEQPFDLRLFSPGQKTLFAYAILFFYMETNSRTNIRDSIIIIDEPEKHLHPEAQIALVSALKEIVSKSGQLWIATHSINILAHLEYDEIFMVKDDGITHPSRTTPGNSFNELMGLDGHIDELTSFINSISEWAYGNFMVQCFKEPEVVFTNNIDDPQYQLFRDFLIKKDIELLDYGAGKGRIGYTLAEDEDLKLSVRYSAYEPDKSKMELLNMIPNITKVFSSKDTLPKETYDCVLLCNVLHEIDPKLWGETFSLISSLIKKDGYLIIVEDKFLPKGENAHIYGYLILGIEQLGKLFTRVDGSMPSITEVLFQNEAYKNRIVFAVIKRSEIFVTVENVESAICSLRDASFESIKNLRHAQKDVSSGRQYANQTQLYINSQLALLDMNSLR